MQRLYGSEQWGIVNRKMLISWEFKVTDLNGILVVITNAGARP